jgi:hypothetical protein
LKICGDCGSAKNLPGLRAARHEVVARAFGRRLGEHRRLDVDEAVAVEVLAHRARDRVTQAQPFLHHVATQVDVTVLEPRLFLDLFVELERDRLRAVQHLDLAREQFDLPGRQVGVGRAGRPRPHRARDLQHPFVAYALGLGEHRRRVGIEDHLQQAVAIAQVDEDDAAVVAPAVHPAGHRHGRSDEALVDLAAVMGTHGHRKPVGRGAGGLHQPARR